MMEVYHILDEIEAMVKEGTKMPLSGGKVLIESNRLLDRIDRIRAIMPEEIETAKLVLNQKDRIVQEACQEAEQFMEVSRTQVARLVDESEITQHAIKMAEDIVNKAEGIALEIRRDANEYADGVLTHIEMVLKRGLDAVSVGRDEIRVAVKDGDF